MIPNLPLKALRAFDAAARHLNFTRAASELCVTPGAVSQQIKILEDKLNQILFTRLPRGLKMTDEGEILYAVISESFNKINYIFKQLEDKKYHEIITISVVGTFAVGWLLPRLHKFHKSHPLIDLRIYTNDNLINFSSEGIDLSILFGDGTWPGTKSIKLMDAPLTAVCSHEIANRLHTPSDLANEILYRSYRQDEWNTWFIAADIPAIKATGPVFDSSRLMVESIIKFSGVALVPIKLFNYEINHQMITQPFPIEINLGSYWLIDSKYKTPTSAMMIFQQWLMEEIHLEHVEI